MRRDHAVFWVVLGVPIAVIDAWLSLQAMFGILNPKNPLNLCVAILVGMAFTAFAVLSETFGLRRSDTGMLFWLVMLALDLGTSTLCAIWYGLMAKPFSSRIDLHSLHYDPSNWFATTIYVFFVLIAAWGCIQLGRALATLQSRDF